MTNIPAERAALAAQGLTMRTREQWGSRFDYTNERACDVPGTRIFLHLAVINPTTMDATQRVIEDIGVNRFPSTGYSYNAAVWPDGILLEGQPLTRRGAHTVNDLQRSPCPNHGGPVTAPSWNLNINSRALVLPQNVQHAVTNAQVDSAARWAAAQKRSGYLTRDARWHGHRDVAAKSCPGDNGFARIAEIEALTEQYIVNGLPGAEPPVPEPERHDMLFRDVNNGNVFLGGPGYFVYVGDPVAFEVLSRPEAYGPAVDVNGVQVDAVKAVFLGGETASDDEAAAVLAAITAIPAPDVDEAALAADLAPLLPELARLSDEDVARIATAVADEQARRLVE